MKKKLVALTGAGISAESGIKTFRDSDGLWEGHNVNDVATPEGWTRNQQLVQDFYEIRFAPRLGKGHPVQARRAHGRHSGAYTLHEVARGVAVHPECAADEVGSRSG